MNIENAEIWVVNNNIASRDWHYVNLDFLATRWSGTPENLEPDKCERIEWFHLNELPEPSLSHLQIF